MTEPEFDEDGYPTEATLEAIRTWSHDNLAGLLDFVAAAWSYPDYVTYELSPALAEVVHAEPDERYLRLATGGWSGNEELITALHANRMAMAVLWMLSARGGLHVYRYPQVEPTEDREPR